LDSVPELLAELQKEIQARSYISQMETLEQSINLLKTRLYISQDIFRQVYRNDRFDTTDLSLILSGRRIYSRDQVGGKWHRHTLIDPEYHDTSSEGQREISLYEFLNEVEAILAQLDLP
jgi:hypothetical protein